MCILVAVLVPETYGPLLLKRRAQALTKMTGDVHVSKLMKYEPEMTLRKKLKIAMSRPWLMLFYEPIVLVLTIYLSLLYGTVNLKQACFIIWWLTCVSFTCSLAPFPLSTRSIEAGMKV